MNKQWFLGCSIFFLSAVFFQNCAKYNFKDQESIGVLGLESSSFKDCSLDNSITLRLPKSIFSENSQNACSDNYRLSETAKVGPLCPDNPNDYPSLLAIDAESKAHPDCNKMTLCGVPFSAKTEEGDTYLLTFKNVPAACVTQLQIFETIDSSKVIFNQVIESGIPKCSCSSLDASGPSGMTEEIKSSDFFSASVNFMYRKLDSSGDSRQNNGNGYSLDGTYSSLDADGDGKIYFNYYYCEHDPELGMVSETRYRTAVELDSIINGTRSFDRFLDLPAGSPSPFLIRDLLMVSKNAEGRAVTSLNPGATKEIIPYTSATLEERQEIDKFCATKYWKDPWTNKKYFPFY